MCRSTDNFAVYLNFFLGCSFQERNPTILSGKTVSVGKQEFCSMGSACVCELHQSAQLSQCRCACRSTWAAVQERCCRVLWECPTACQRAGWNGKDLPGATWVKLLHVKTGPDKNLGALVLIKFVSWVC